MHNMVEQVARSIVYRGLWHYESLGRLVVDDMGAEQHGEHVIQLLADEVG